jgi:hypothetical protein
MSKNPYDSDFGAIFKQRYEKDILDDRNIKKSKVKKAGLIGKVAGGLAANALFPANPLATGIGVGLGDEIEHGITNKMEKEANPYGLPPKGPIAAPPMGKPIDSPMEKMEKENNYQEEAFLAEELGDKSGLSPEELKRGQSNKHLNHAISAKDSYPKTNRGLEKALPTDADTMKSLRKAIGSIDSILQKLDSCDGAKAGLNIKKVTQGKEHVFKPKSIPKPKQKKA